MKKGFTMIELIFVIVILGILASVAIPRLAATREDAEISAAVANLRTLVSDINAYYTVKGEFGSTTKWSEITNVPLNKDGKATEQVSLAVGGDKDCIRLQLQDKADNLPARIIFTPKKQGATASCSQVLAADAVKAYVESTVANFKNPNGGAMAIGSTTSVYTPAKK
ncbi:type II secretion system protein [Campylobacter sp.]|uniref:type II secretion system protein n=1 Tax=Campylobacter sp. TaxID=205 RepID=UPI002A4E946A|nr:type II secretion system protein [Campylobacter sp.]MDD7090451.1 type II secretion system protein [Campylobacteraceae bacterium]MDY5284728.1 type II secretion system protein [Campylobacter sp.]